MGSYLSAEKSAAAKVGCSVEEWRTRRHEGSRWCFRCRQWKRIETFSLDRTRGGGRASICKPCNSDASTASRYGLTPAGLRQFREDHDKRCGICGKTDGPLYVDHDHSNGKLRGLLCPGCNAAIGFLREDPAMFAKALAYLEKANG